MIEKKLKMFAVVVAIVLFVVSSFSSLFVCLFSAATVVTVLSTLAHRPVPCFCMALMTLHWRRTIPIIHVWRTTCVPAVYRRNLTTGTSRCVAVWLMVRNMVVSSQTMQTNCSTVDDNQHGISGLIVKRLILIVCPVSATKVP